MQFVLDPLSANGVSVLPPRKITVLGSGGGSSNLSSDIQAALDKKQQKMSIVVGIYGNTGYVTDGTDDQVQINAAGLAVSTAGGGVVELPDRSYTLGSNTYIQMYDNVWYRGGGMFHTVIGVASGHNQTIFGDLRYYPFGAGQLTDCMISDLQLDGTNQTGASVFAKGIAAFRTLRLRLQNVYCYNTTATGIGPDFNVDCLIDNCIAELCGKGDLNPGYNGFGIGTGDTNESVLLTNCMAINCYNGGFLLERQDGTPQIYPREYQFSNCYARGCKTGFRNSGCSGVTFTNCRARDNDERGFYIERYTNVTVPHDNTIIGCEAYNNGLSGIEFDADTRLHNAIIQGNRSFSNGSHGIVASGSNMQILNNISFLNKNTGIKIAPTRNRSTGGADITILGYSDLENLLSMKVHGNTCYNNGINNVNGETEGIRLSLGTIPLYSSSISDNSCYDNQTVPTQSYGIRAQGDIARTNFVDNEIYGHAVGGIYTIVESATATDMKYINNSAYNNGRTASAVFPNRRGIHIQGNSAASGFVSGLLVQGNHCYDNQGSPTQIYGISISENVTNAKVIDNDCRNNVTAAINNGAVDDSSIIYENNSGVSDVNTKTLNYTLDSLDKLVLMDTTGGNRTATLPTAVNRNGRKLGVKKIAAANTLTIATTSSQTIDGSLTATTAVNNTCIEVESDGSNWQVI